MNVCRLLLVLTLLAVNCACQRWPSGSEKVDAANTAYAQHVEAQLAAGDFPGAKQTLSAWAKNVRKPPAKFDELRGDVAFAEDDRATALLYWSRVVAAQPRNSDVLTKLARLQQTRGHWSEAAHAWTKLLELRDDAEARLNRATCRRHLHDWDGAFADIHRAAELASGDAQVQNALEAFDRIAKFLPDIRNLDLQLTATPMDAALLSERALLFLRCEDAELALEDAEGAEKLAGWMLRPKLFRALAVIALGRDEELRQLGARDTFRLENLSPEFLHSVAQLDSEISVDRKNAELYVRRAWQLNEIGQPELALGDAETALQVDPQSAGAWAESSYALAKLGRTPDALDRLRRATALDGKLGTAWLYRGELQLAAGDHLAAIESLSRAISYAPTAAALRKREEAYRRIGSTAKADEDRRAWQALEPASQ